jgi:outer membrane protein assembly factor BamD
MKFQRAIVSLILTAFVAASLACGGGAKSKVSTEEVREGRDRELYAEGLRSMRRKRYEEGRLLLGTLISTYDGSPLLPLAKLLMADSFYREGGSSNLAQADVEYREWLQFFPQHPLADDVLLKIAQIHVRQLGPYNQDISEARRAERELLRLTREYPQSALNDQVKEYLKFVREQLGMHSLDIARLYFKQQRPNAVKGRCEQILKNYPEFTLTDEVLFLHGVVLAELEDTPSAGKSFARIVRDFPESKYRDKAAEFLERFQVPIPDADPNAKPIYAARKGFIKRKFEEIFGPSADVPKEGIILRKDDSIDPEVEKLLAQAGVRVDVITPDSIVNNNKGQRAGTYNGKDSNPAQPNKPSNDPQPKTTSNEPTVKPDDKKKDKKKKKDDKSAAATPRQ